MITKIRLAMPLEEYEAIEKAAAAEFRNTHDQIRFVLRQDLQRRGLLPAETQPVKTQPVKAQPAGNGGDHAEQA